MCSSEQHEKNRIRFDQAIGSDADGYRSALMANDSLVGAYGQELILDLHSCDVSRFNRAAIEKFCAELCDLIDMERCDLHFWDDVGVPEEEQQTDPKTRGTSAVQFILTSTIVIHTLDLMKAAYVNIFSCKDFDAAEAAKFTADWFGSTEWTSNVVIRC
jgi:S-adenosylmethionine/arginine decarboxylase-like enzyme